jgi:ElaB/YqjD/DUF883 family membrane-anchored ribosome-binding protein
MIRSITVAGFVLVGLAGYAVGQQTRVPEIVLAQNKVKNFMDETERVLDPILRKKGNDASEDSAKQQGLKALAILKTAIGELRDTTDKQVDRIVAAAKK